MRPSSFKIKFSPKKYKPNPAKSAIPADWGLTKEKRMSVQIERHYPASRFRNTIIPVKSCCKSPLAEAMRTRECKGGPNKHTSQLELGNIIFIRLSLPNQNGPRKSETIHHLYLVYFKQYEEVPKMVSRTFALHNIKSDETAVVLESRGNKTRAMSIAHEISELTGAHVSVQLRKKEK
jgi:hypothetical protein